MVVVPDRPSVERLRIPHFVRNDSAFPVPVPTALRASSALAAA
jgi:hypothetical protein